MESLEKQELECRKQIAKAREIILGTFRSVGGPLRQRKSHQVADEPSSEVRNKIEALQNRVEKMKEKVRVSAEEIEKLSAEKEALERRVKEVVGEKMKAEFSFRTAQCQVLELRLKFYNSVHNEEGERVIAEAEKRASRCETELGQMEVELDALKEEEGSLTEQLDEAKESHNGSSQVLLILQAELKKLDPAVNFEGPTSVQKANAEDRIRAFVALERRAIKLMYLKTLVQVDQKEKEWLETIRRIDDDDE